MDNKSIYIIFDKHEITQRDQNGNRNEMLDALVDPYSKVVTLDEIMNKSVSLDGAKAIMDCTNNYVFYNTSLNKKTGFEFKTDTGEMMIKTQKGTFVMKGVQLHELLSSINSKKNISGKLSENDYEYEKELEAIEVINKMSESKISEHHRRLYELGKQVPYIVNSRRYEKAMTSGGIELSVESFREVRYQLVPDEKATVDPGVEKITPSDIKLLKDLHLILEHLK